MKSNTVRTRALLIILGVVVLALAIGGERAQRALAGLETPDAAFQSPFDTPTLFPTATPFFFTPFPPGPPVTSPTPTLDFSVVNKITNPQDGDAVAGFAIIEGSTIIDDFVRYDVHYAVTGSENWQWLATSRNAVRNGVVHVLNTYQLPDGRYDLRVRAIARDGDYTEAIVRRLEVRNAMPPTVTPVVDAFGTLQPASPLLIFPTPSPTVTPTPRFRSYVPNSQGIFEPQSGDVIRGQVPVVGTVNGKTALNPFDRYELYITPSGLEEWSWLYTSSEQFWQSQIYTLDTTQLADGFYDLRLRIVYRDSNYDEYYVTRLRVDNARQAAAIHPTATRTAAKTPGLYFPFDDIRVTGVVDFVGTTAVPKLLRWEIYWSPAGAGEWKFLFSDTKPVVNGYLARLDLGLLPEGAYDFRLRIVRQDYTYSDYYVQNVVAIPPTPTPVPVPPFP
ncbi:MAG: hypothetical protein M9936_31735 [Caldilinea sp.]|nr:hypothetical protein [Caldilineaceae bacterium]MCB9114427.1 hypothetical protein [Caldilineaceae bacterium]MCB9119612.1 hypothetical protein [Caldilineaceae bacterium]MCO5214295.1 hypothetical protein [Caldilinea sp.]MCW5842257.1 hypothetical protein [Caldilinea sp.]